MRENVEDKKEERGLVRNEMKEEKEEEEDKKENNSKQEKEEEEIYDVSEIFRTMRREKIDGQEEEELVKK